MNAVLPFVILGIVAGILSGLIGIGGGIIIIPALVLIFGFSQQMAQGTTLALLVPPIGFFAALMYYRMGYVDIKAALFICAGFIVGSIAGAKLATGLSNVVLEKVFGVVLLIIGVKMIFFK
ncbi:MAG TPA: TSUP family transporter [Syntrophorhabdaceae bacterium]|nr:TSUP family transporter [Syntrophorhabdaceae bacterium]